MVDGRRGMGSSVVVVAEEGKLAVLPRTLNLHGRYQTDEPSGDLSNFYWSSQPAMPVDHVYLCPVSVLWV